MTNISSFVEYVNLSKAPPPRPEAFSALIAPENRLYLQADGTIPGINKAPSELNPPAPTFKGSRAGVFIDKRWLMSTNLKAYNDVHSTKKDQMAYGGIFINDEGKVLMRQPSTGDQTWSFAKGAAKKGESPEDAAIREVEEETGIKGSIVGEIPGHYDSKNSGNKYFLMHANIDDDHINSFKSDETDKLQWMTQDEAIQALKDNKDFTSLDDVSSSSRDLHVLTASFNHNEKKNTPSSIVSKVQESLSVQTASLENQIKDLADLYASTGKLPDDLTKDPKLSYLVQEVAYMFSHPESDQLGGRLQAVSALPDEIMGALDKKYKLGSSDYTFQALHRNLLNAWKGDASVSSVPINLIQEVVGERFNKPHTYMFGNAIPEDVNHNGDPIYRSDKQRQEIIDVFEKYKNAEDFQAAIDASSGEYSWGEKYDYTDENTVTIKDTDGKPLEINSHALMARRAMSVRDARKNASQYKADTINDNLRRYGESFIKANNIDSSNLTDDEIREHGRDMLREYVDHTLKLNEKVLDSIYPNHDHVIIWRKTNDIREVLGGHGVAGDTSLTLSKHGMPSKAKEDSHAEGFKARVSSTAMAGGSMHPNINYVNSRKFAIATKVPKSNFVMLHAFMYPKGSTGTQNERETIYVTERTADSRIIHHGTSGSPIFSASGKDNGWVNWGNGWTPKNLFGKYTDNGVVNSDLDYGTSSLEEGGLINATAEDVGATNVGQLGSNKGGTKKDKDGNIFYVKSYGVPDKAKKEVFANNLFKQAGINVPNMELINYNGGLATKSDWLKGHKKHNKLKTGEPPKKFTNNSDIYDGFFVDCLLANYDVAGQDFDNFVEGKDKKIYRIDHGGTFQHRAMSTSEKENWYSWGAGHIPELDTMLDTTNNAGKVFQGMSDKDIKKSAQNLFKLTDSNIKQLATKSGVNEDVAHHLIRRRDSIIDWLVENYPQQIGHSSKESLQNEYNILKSVLFKADDEVEEQGPDFWVTDKELNDDNLSKETDEDTAYASKLKDIINYEFDSYK